MSTIPKKLPGTLRMWSIDVPIPGKPYPIISERVSVIELSSFECLLKLSQEGEKELKHYREKILENMAYIRILEDKSYHLMKFAIDVEPSMLPEKLRLERRDIVNSNKDFNIGGVQMNTKSLEGGK